MGQRLQRRAAAMMTVVRGRAGKGSVGLVGTGAGQKKASTAEHGWKESDLHQDHQPLWRQGLISDAPCIVSEWKRVDCLLLSWTTRSWMLISQRSPACSTWPPWWKARTCWLFRNPRLEIAYTYGQFTEKALHESKRAQRT